MVYVICGWAGEHIYEVTHINMLRNKYAVNQVCMKKMDAK